MEGTKKKVNKKIKALLMGIIVFFIFVYIGGMSGYYETHVRRETSLTAEAILEFEKDLAEGEPVDIRNYIDETVNDYRNGYSRLGYNISSGINTVLTDGLTGAIDFFKVFFD